ncbi:MAG: 30S ribosomal protein S3 [Candidatus Micrarchaeota archaeon]
MAVEKKLFLAKAVANLKIKSFLYRELEKAGVSNIEIQKTPIATRISVSVRRPGFVVGRRGKSIKDVCFALERQFKVENPQVEVIEVQAPALDAKLMAEKIGKRIESKPNVKPIMRIALQEIMQAGAVGAEIRVAGKVVGKGGKAKVFTVRKGYLKKSGDLVKFVRVGTYTTYLSAGAVGINVKIVPPGVILTEAEQRKAKKEAKAPVEVVEEVVPAEAAGEAVPAEAGKEAVEQGA